MRELISITLVTILSQTLPANAISSACGKASFYGLGDGFAGKLTASGEVMNPNAMITAHRSLPFGSRLLVTNKNNGRQVVVRVSDRGPFVGNRILDLSSGAFTKIAPASSGVTDVCYRRLV
jgi:rare lipoprotein A